MSFASPPGSEEDPFASEEDQEITENIEPLIRAFVSNDAVAVVGAGASISAGLPSWNHFLRDCLAKARTVSSDDVQWKYIEVLLDTDRFLTAAELLQLEIGLSLESYIWDAFGAASTPTDVHLAIARLPFSLAVTTNYDKLLESAYTQMGKPLPNICTWQNPDAIYRAIRDQRFTVLKTHGTVGHGPSLVLTHTQYRDLMTRNRSFNDLMSNVLRFKTCLFIGHSLRDSDLLTLLAEARVVHGDSVGPHYAILFEKEKSRYELNKLREEFGITPILIKGCPNHPDPYACTRRVVSVLKQIHGYVALHRTSSVAIRIEEDPSFSQVSLARDLLQEAIEVTGGFRGDLCFVEQPTAPHLTFSACQWAPKTRQRWARQNQPLEAKA